MVMHNEALIGRLARAGHNLTFSAKPYRGPGSKTDWEGRVTVTATIDPPLPRSGDPSSKPLASVSATAETESDGLVFLGAVIRARLDAIVENERRLASESLRLAREYRSDAESYDAEAAKYADESR